MSDCLFPHTLQSGIAIPPESVSRSFNSFEYGFQISSDDESKDTKCDEEDEPTSKEGSAPDNGNGSNENGNSGNDHGSNGNGNSGNDHGSNGNGNGTSRWRRRLDE